MMEFWFLNFIWKKLAPKIIHKLRIWDFIASKRVDFFITNSKNTALRVKKYYKREAKVIYPWIDVENFFIKNEKKQDFYLYVWRCIPYKKFDLVVDAFNKNWKKIILVTNTDNKLYRELREKSNKNIIWKLKISREETKKLFNQAKWFLFPVDEDFWLVPIEAQASKTPVIAYKKGWVLETVIENETWIFFDEQNVDSLNKAIEKFENKNFDKEKILENAKKFDKKIFQENLINFILEKI
jgi:glycosyltransferase involved in cell wall biosynthesis